MAGYRVVSMGVPIQDCDGVAVFYRVLPRFSIKALQKFVPTIAAPPLPSGI